LNELYKMATGHPRPPGRPGVLLAPESFAALRHGIDQMAELVRPTLGPLPRCVAMTGTERNAPPEVLDHAALTLRRVVQLPDPYADMGAMLLRHAVWRMYEDVGDGGATTAVLMQAIVSHSASYLAAGGDAWALSRGLELGMAAALGSLREQGRPLRGTSEIAHAAESLCHDPDMAALLGEALGLMGPDGYVQLEDGYGRGLELQHLEGACWYEGYLSTAFVTDDARQEVALEEPAVLVSDLALTTAEQLAPVLQRVAACGRRSLLVIAREVSGGALRLLVTNHEMGMLRLLAVRAPASGSHQADILRDLAVLTGACVVTEAAGDRAEDVELEDLGYARSVLANAGAFTILGGGGDPDRLRRRAASARAQMKMTEDPADREKVRERLSKLTGGVAIIKVGAATRPEADARKASAERAVQVLRRALAGGVAPGGGGAYLACRPVVGAVPVSGEGERVGLRVLCAALAEPLRVIAENAGYEAAVVIAEAGAAPYDSGFDARSGRIVDMWAAGVVDPVLVLEKVLVTAVSAAMAVLTTSVLVHHREPEVVFEP